MNMNKCLFVGFLLVAFAAGPGGAQDELSGKALVEALRQGGYNIYFRHAATDWTQEDHVSIAGDWQSCDPQQMRQLSAEGLAVARRLGEAIRRLTIPIGRVFSSEYCRTRMTAQSMDLGMVTPTLAIMNMRAAGLVGGREIVIDRARRILSTIPRGGANNVFVAHGNLLQAAVGTYTGEAGAVIIRPFKNHTFEVVAKLEPLDWEQLADEFAATAE